LLPVQPDPEYLAKIGALVHIVGSLEWLIMADLESLGAKVPAKFRLEKLAGMTTGAMSKAIAKAADLDEFRGLHDEIRHYVTTAAEALEVMAKHRNDVLHARPAMRDGKPVLLRFQEGVKFVITHEWLDDKIAQGQDWMSRLTGGPSTCR
jgi:hypothetical protein